MPARALVALLAAAAAVSAAAPPPSRPHQPPPREALVRALWRLASAGDAGRLRQVAVTQPGLLNESVGGAGVFVPLLEGWHAAIEALPAPAPAGADHEAAMRLLLAAGADPALGCPLLDALVTRNAAAVKALLRASHLAALARCLVAYDTTGQGLLHAAARTPASGFARHLFRTSAPGVAAGGGDAAAARAAVARAREVLDLRVAGTPLDADADADVGSGGRPRGQQLRIVPKAAIEAAAGDAALTALLAAARRLNKALRAAAAAATPAAPGGDERLPPPLAPSEWLDLHDGAGHTPLTLACAHGRARAVAALLKAGADPLALAQTAPAEVVDGGTPQQPASPHPPVGSGLACAHAAASRGHVDVLEALCNSTGGQEACAQLLMGHTDSHGRTAAEVAAAHDRALFAPVTEWIAQRVKAASEQKDAAQTVVAGSKGNPPVWPRRLPPQWDTARHAGAGWAVASPAQLARVSLPPSLFGDDGSGGVEVATSGAAACGGGCAVSTAVDEVPPEWLVAPPGSPGATALHRGFLSIGKPFVVRQWAQFCATQGGDGGNHTSAAVVGADASSIQHADDFDDGAGAWLSGYLPASPFVAPRSRLGALVVAPGGVPYADTYAYRDEDEGGGGATSRQQIPTATTMPLAEFVAAHMGPDAEAARAAAAAASSAASASSSSSSLSSSSSSSSSSSPPRHHARRPPYVFDGKAMHAHPALFGRLLGALLPAALGKGTGGGGDGTSSSQPQQPPASHQLRQLIVGPPLSGAQPHFHGPAVNVLLAGAKAWALTPPATAGFVRSHAADWFAAGGYCHVDGAPAGCVPHLRFLQGPGDLVWVPEHWGHAVLNLADAVAVAVE